MANDTTTINRLVTSLTERLGCESLTYNPTNSVSVRPGPQRYMFPIGPYALELCHPGDDVHLVCLTDNSSNTFWEYIAEKLDREDLPKHDCVISRPGDEANVWLHYCSTPLYFDLATVEAYGFPKHPESTYVPQAVRQNLARLQDTWHLLDRLRTDLDIFRHDYDTLRRWAEAAGIFSKDFGTLDAESLLWMLFNTKSATTQRSIDEGSTLSTGIQSFMNHHNIENILTPSGRNVYAPPAHIAMNSHATIKSAIDQLSLHPSSVFLSTQQHYQHFCNSFQSIILVSAECWTAAKQRDTFRSQLINQITHLPERFRASGLDPQHLRFWPHPFKPSKDEWVYVVGVNRRTPISSPIPKAELQNFVSDSQLELDNTAGVATLTICSAEEALALPEKYKAPNLPKTLDCLKCHSPPRLDPSSLSSKKFPPASQVISRLRWDPAHTPFDYEVGYLDRFEGLMWLPLEQWGRETEEEEFIPEHRIRIFRRIGKGNERVVVWSREERICGLGG